MSSALHTLSDGTIVLLREQTAGDRGLLAGLFARVSPTTRYLRFATGMPPELPAHVLDRLAAVDGHDHAGVLALHAGEVVGAARYIRSTAAPAQADVAVTVADELHGRGLGAALVGALCEHARAHGVERLTFDMLAVNWRAAGLARSLGAHLSSSGSALEGALELPAQISPRRAA